MKRVALVFLLLLLGGVVFGQQERVDVLYLKNGSAIRGYIVEVKPSESVSIETADGSLFVFPFEEVLQITKEQLEPSAMPEKRVRFSYYSLHAGAGCTYSREFFAYGLDVKVGELNFARQSGLGGTVIFGVAGLVSSSASFPAVQLHGGPTFSWPYEKTSILHTVRFTGGLTLLTYPDGIDEVIFTFFPFTFGIGHTVRFMTDRRVSPLTAFDFYYYPWLGGFAASLTVGFSVNC